MTSVPESTDASGNDGSSTLVVDLVSLRWIHFVALLILGAGLMFDTLEATMTSVLATVFARTGAMPQSQLALVLGAMFIGGAVGAPLGGRIGDRIGRRKALLLALAGYAAMSLFAAFSVGVPQLVVARFLGGMALAAYPPLMWTYMADISPPANRGRLIMLSSAIGGSGATLAPLLTRIFDGGILLGLDGWRAAFAVGGIGGVLVAGLTLFLPESPRWLLSVGRSDAAMQQSERFSSSRPILARRASALLVRPPRIRAAADPGNGSFGPRLALLFILQLLQPIAVIGFLVLSGVVLKHKGFSVRETLLYGSASAIGSPIGALLASIVIDRFSRPRSFIACALVLAAAGFGFAYSTSARAEIACGLVFMLVGTIYTSILSAYGSEMFSTRVRGLSSGFGYGANRIGAALVPFGLLPLLLSTGPILLFELIGATLLVSALLVGIWGPRGTVGRSLS